MKHGRKRIVGFFVGLSLAVMGVPTLAFGVGNNPQWGQDIPTVQVWLDDASCSGTKISPYHVLTASHCIHYEGTEFENFHGMVITSNSGMTRGDAASSRIFLNGGNISKVSVYQGADIALITTKVPLSGAVANVVNTDTIRDQIPSMQVSACGTRLVDPNTGQAVGRNNASCATVDGPISLNGNELTMQWANGVDHTYYGDSGGGVFGNGNLIGVLSSGLGKVTCTTCNPGSQNMGFYSPQPLITSSVYSWLQSHGVPLSGGAAPAKPQQPGMQAGKSRVGGTNRVGTSLLLLDKAANKNEVVLATGRNFPDGLVAGALAGATKSGVVLTMGTNAIEPETLSKLKSVGTSKVTIVGGTGAVSQSVEDSLKAAGIQVVRIAGTDRYDTAFQVFENMKASGKVKLNGRGEPYVFVATGRNFPDALTASSMAAKVGAAVVLADNQTHINRIGKVSAYLVGGQMSQFASQLSNSGSLMGTAFGANRYETAFKVVTSAAWNLPQSDTVMVAIGTNYPDALAAGGLSASTGQLLVLANLNSNTLKVPAGTKNLVFIGGEATNPDKYAVIS